MDRLQMKHRNLPKHEEAILAVPICFACLPFIGCYVIGSMSTARSMSTALTIIGLPSLQNSGKPIHLYVLSTVRNLNHRLEQKKGFKLG